MNNKSIKNTKWNNQQCSINPRADKKKETKMGKIKIKIQILIQKYQ